MYRIILKLFFALSEKLYINFKFRIKMSEKSNKTWSIVLTIVKYAITVVLGALGASNKRMKT